MATRRSGLRAIRVAVSRPVGALLAACPRLEPLFIVAGRLVARWSHLFGTLYWFAEEDLIWRLRASGRRFRRVSVAGVEVLADVTDGSARLHYFHGEPYEPALAAALRAALRPGDVFVDVGANIGFFTVLAARIVGTTGRVVAFEPHPDALLTLRASVAINGVTDIVEVIEAAIGAAAEGTTRLFLSQDTILSTTDPGRSPARDHFLFERSITVRSLSLDHWLQAHPAMTSRITAVKIDVEGTELDVLEGMRVMRMACPHVVILCETDMGSPADRLLRAEGYAASALDLRAGFGTYLYARNKAVAAAIRDKAELER